MSLHLDPDFDSLSYGEPSRPKLAQLLSLEKGDKLFFLCWTSARNYSRQILKDLHHRFLRS